MKCCGKDVETPYCPVCGEENDLPGPTLLAYCKKRHEECQKLKARSETVFGNERTEALKANPRYQRLAKSAVQWQVWVQFVQAAIKAQPGNNSESLHWKCTCGRNNNPTRKLCWKCGAPPSSTHIELCSTPKTHSETTPAWGCACATKNNRATDLSCWHCGAPCDDHFYSIEPN